MFLKDLWFNYQVDREENVSDIHFMLLFSKESQKNIIDQKKTDLIKQLFSDDKLMIT